MVQHKNDTWGGQNLRFLHTNFTAGCLIPIYVPKNPFLYHKTSNFFSFLLDRSNVRTTRIPKHKSQECKSRLHNFSTAHARTRESYESLEQLVLVPT